MGRTEFLIDTNVAIDYLGENLPAKGLLMLDDIIDDIFYFSVINQIELLGFSNITADEEQKFRLLLNASNLLDLDEDIVNKTVRIRRHYKIKLPDAIIAATCLVYDLTLVTRNTKDFNRIEHLNVLNLHDR